MAYSPKRAMAELRHSTSIGARSSSPMKRDDDSSPLAPDTLPDDDGGRGRRDHDRSFMSHFLMLCPFLPDEARVSSHNSKISTFLLVLIAFVGLISVFSIFWRLVSHLSLSLSFFLYIENWICLFVCCMY